MNDTEYHQLADDLLISIQEAVDEVDFDLDYEAAGGIVEIIFPNGTKIIINKQAPLHQIWVATKFNGHHFENLVALGTPNVKKNFLARFARANNFFNVFFLIKKNVQGH